MELDQWIQEELKEDQADNLGLDASEVLLSDDDLREVLRLAKKTADPFARSTLGENAVLLPPVAPSEEDVDQHERIDRASDRNEGSVGGAYDEGGEQSHDNSKVSSSPNLVKQASQALEAFKNEAESYINRPVIEFQCNIPEIFKCTPEFWLGRGVEMIGPCRVDRLIHFDGNFEGTLQCVNNKISSIRVGAFGSVEGNIENAYAVLVYGKIVGNVESEKVIVLEDGSICGNVTCKSIFISHGTEVIGKVNINKRAPYEIDTDFKVQGVAENVERYRVSNKDGSFPGPAIDPMLLEAPLPENSAAYNVDKEEDAVMIDKLGICD